LPITINTAIVSPNAFEKPKPKADKMPDEPLRKKTSLMVSHFVAPSESAA
jgi:hypothetical protein